MSPRKQAKVKLKKNRDNVYAVPQFQAVQGISNEVLVPRVVPDPYKNPDKPHETLTIMASIRNCPLGKAYAEGRIDKAEWDAGLTWLGFYEIATLGDLRGFEIKTPVDGAGAFPEAISDKRKKAVDELARAKTEVGARGDKLLREVLGNRRFISDIASSLGYLDDYGKPMKRMVYHLNLMFKGCLEDLSHLYGTAMKSNGVKKRI